jgi:hypothetical protein
MKSICQVCSQPYRGIALNSVKDGKTVEVCPNCYKTLDAEYRKNSCLACVLFHAGLCELYGTELEEPYVQNAKCEHFTTSADSKNASAAKIKKFEMMGRFEDAAKEYEKLGNKEKAEEARKQIKEKTFNLLSIDEAIGQLGKRGQTLTYFCCHCGAPLKVGGKQEIQKTCPNCKYDLSAIDLGKLISQHL